MTTAYDIEEELPDCPICWIRGEDGDLRGVTEEEREAVIISTVIHDLPLCPKHHEQWYGRRQITSFGFDQADRG